VRLLIAELCQEYNVSLPDEVHAIDNYLSSKVNGVYLKFLCHKHIEAEFIMITDYITVDWASERHQPVKIE